MFSHAFILGFLDFVVPNLFILSFCHPQLILIISTLRTISKIFKNEKFMRWWIDAVAGLIQHWYSIEENIATNAQTKSKEQL